VWPTVYPVTVFEPQQLKAATNAVVQHRQLEAAMLHSEHTTIPTSALPFLPSAPRSHRRSVNHAVSLSHSSDASKVDVCRQNTDYTCALRRLAYQNIWTLSNRHKGTDGQSNNQTNIQNHALHYIYSLGQHIGSSWRVKNVLLTQGRSNEVSGCCN
jgi:hypothetical protein